MATKTSRYLEEAAPPAATAAPVPKGYLEETIRVYRNFSLLSENERTADATNLKTNLKALLVCRGMRFDGPQSPASLPIPEELSGVHGFPSSAELQLLYAMVVFDDQRRSGGSDYREGWRMLAPLLEFCPETTDTTSPCYCSAKQVKDISQLFNVALVSEGERSEHVPWGWKPRNEGGAGASSAPSEAKEKKGGKTSTAAASAGSTDLLTFPILGSVLSNPSMAIDGVVNDYLFAMVSDSTADLSYFCRILSRFRIKRATFRSPRKEDEALLLRHVLVQNPTLKAALQNGPMPFWARRTQQHVECFLREGKSLKSLPRSYPVIPGVPKLYTQLLSYACSEQHLFPTLVPHELLDLDWFKQNNFLRSPNSKTIPWFAAGTAAPPPATTATSSNPSAAAAATAEAPPKFAYGYNPELKLHFNAPISLSLLQVVHPRSGDRPATDFYIACGLLRAFHCFHDIDCRRDLGFLQGYLSDDDRAKHFIEALPALLVMGLSMGLALTYPVEYKEATSSLQIMLCRLAEALSNASKMNSDAIKDHEEPGFFHPKTAHASAKLTSSIDTLRSGLEVLHSVGLDRSFVTRELLSNYAVIQMLTRGPCEAKRVSAYMLEMFPCRFRCYVIAGQLAAAEGKDDAVVAFGEMALENAVWEMALSQTLAQISDRSRERLRLKGDSPVVVRCQSLQQQLRAAEINEFQKARELEDLKATVQLTNDTAEAASKEKKDADSKMEATKKVIASKERQLQSVKDSLKKERSKKPASNAAKDPELQRLTSQITEETRRVTSLEAKLSNARREQESIRNRLEAEISKLQQQLESQEEDDEEILAAEAEFQEWLRGKEQEKLAREEEMDREHEEFMRQLEQLRNAPSGYHGDLLRSGDGEAEDDDAPRDDSGVISPAGRRRGRRGGKKHVRRNRGDAEDGNDDGDDDDGHGPPPMAVAGGMPGPAVPPANLPPPPPYSKQLYATAAAAAAAAGAGRPSEPLGVNGAELAPSYVTVVQSTESSGTGKGSHRPAHGDSTPGEGQRKWKKPPEPLDSGDATRKLPPPPPYDAGHLSRPVRAAAGSALNVPAPRSRQGAKQ